MSDIRHLTARLRDIVGARYVVTDARRMQSFTRGYRCGGGDAVAVVRPGSLVEQWRALRACIDAGVIVIAQAANTGLTGGSTPSGTYDRPVVVINTMRLVGLHVVRGGAQVVCLPGATLHALERALAPLGREPHSVIGSSCIGASVFGGVCNNSGGALIQRGPAYTELALFAQLGADGELQLVNHLDIDLGSDPETILRRLEAGDFNRETPGSATQRLASDRRYIEHVRDVEASTPARYNADPSRLFEASGSAGKVMVFAVRLDTFPADKETATFYIGTNDATELTELRRHILTKFASLPIAAEYMHRGAYDMAEAYGKDMVLAIRYLGTRRLPALFALKERLDRLARRFGVFPQQASDHILQGIGRLFPRHLPARMKACRETFEHHLVLKMGADGIAEARAHLASAFPSRAGDVFECTPEEAQLAFLHRFAVAGAAIRYRALHGTTVEDIVALDVALPRNDRNWVERLPDHLSKRIVHTLYYGHFFCHVFHQDYIIAKGEDPIAMEEEMCALLDQRGAEYPAEHNVGHLYHAKTELVAHYRALDPCNTFNPGIGFTSKCKHWA